MPLAVYRDVQWLMSDMYERIMNGGFADVNYMIMQSNMTMMSMS